MAKDFNIEILTPNRAVYAGQSSEVYLPAYDGQTGVLPGHGDFVGLLGTGVLRSQSKGQTQHFMVSGGLYSMLENTLSIFAEIAEIPEEIDAAKASARMKEIEQIYADHAHYQPEDYDKLKADYEKNRARVEACAKA